MESLKKCYTHRKSFGDGYFNIKDKNTSSEACAGFNWLLGTAKYTTNTARDNRVTYEIYTDNDSLYIFK